MSIQNPGDFPDFQKHFYHQASPDDVSASLPINTRNVDRRSQWFKHQEIAPGLTIDVATYPQQVDHYMAYLPESDNIYIFGKAFDEMEAGHELNIDLAGLHETDHAYYFRLSASQQHALTDTIMEIVSKNPEAATIFKDFVQAMYRRPGADYLQAHRFNNPEVSKIKVHSDKQAGLKDFRPLDIDVTGKGQIEKVQVGLVMTELFAYMSATHHPELLDPETLDSINARDVVMHAKNFREKFIDTNPSVQLALNVNGRHGLKRPIPNFRKFILKQ